MTKNPSVALLRALIKETILEAPSRPAEEDIFKGSGFSGLEGKKILILGDSHVANVYSLGKGLEKKFESQGAIVERFGWGGSAARTWLRGEPMLGNHYTLTQVSAAGPYDIAIISLGTNDAGNSEVLTKQQKDSGLASKPLPEVRANCQTYASQIRQVADSVNAFKVYWVGPPVITGSPNPLYSPRARELIYQFAAPLFGSRTIRSDIPVSGDGVHVTGAAQDWIDLVFNRVAAEEVVD